MIFERVISMIFISKYLVPKGYTGMTMYPFVFLKEKALKSDIVLINHEYIHLRQQLELLILPFYVWYFLEYLFGLMKYRNHRRAYRNISFEREAFLQESNMEYLKTRPFFAFLKYLCKHEI